MKIAHAYRGLVRQITAVYDEREARNIARLVFEDAFGVRNLNREDELPTEQASRLQDIAQRLINGEPWQYILGQADFYGLKFTVTSDTLIPRAETEELVYEILQDHPVGSGRSVLDIGTGTGCIPLTLKEHRPNWAVAGLDVSQGALEVASQNAAQLGSVVHFLQADILDEQSWPRFPVYDLIVSNPPYIPPSEARLMPKHVLEHEPHLALFTDTENALVFYEVIARFAKAHLSSGGMLYYELNEFNGAEVLKTVESQGFKMARLKQDMSGKPRILRAVKG
ncbi:peptide chain release factor N(5)-glutamine methyltransferase [Phaeodactylibacter sp.]|uniref:peptide chain release factor N(5)-glutamine methyltransferase n=2 Tax=Phaeodactylibacter sp. TaxID=1940289 RepID=UPI0025FC44FE|nr:peptide chain release factor N(5)-glutamine methyltransferase [Phaeodactylibacter sp.]MCI5091461.1 peptide chain release factor N(5)-glutamine methyltransferase [Phaeodactylibacter sp.]